MKKTTLALSLLLSALATPAVAAAAEPDGTVEAPEAETVEAVDVQLKIKAGKKEIGQLAGLVAWNQPAELAMQVDGHEHVTKVEVSKSGNKLEVKLGYLRDGETVLDTIQVAAAARKKVVKSSDGKIAIALTVAPKNVTPDQLPRPKHKIELPTDSTDPLAGLP